MACTGATTCALSQAPNSEPRLEAETGVRASAIDEGIKEQTENGIEESEKHDRAWPGRRLAR